MSSIVGTFQYAKDGKLTPIHITPRVTAFGTLQIHKNTSCINTPPCFNYITKIKYYDKARQLKEQQGLLIPPLYRLELTIQTKGKLKYMFIPTDEIREVTKLIQGQF